MYSSSFLVHLVGGIALSQLILKDQHQFDSLNTKNTTDALHNALDTFVAVFSFLPDVGIEALSVGAVLRVIVYAIATLYVLLPSKVSLTFPTMQVRDSYHHHFYFY